MAAKDRSKVTFGMKLTNYFAKNPKEADVTFLVGPERKLIKSLKIALKAASIEMDNLFTEKWDIVLKQNKFISLPHLDPIAFEIFIELLLSDNMTEEEIQALNLPLETIFGLIAIANQFEMLEWEILFQSMTDDILENFSTFSESEFFLKLSRSHLEAILSSELLDSNEIDIFKLVCRWAENQCLERGFEPTGENKRRVLGGVLFKIRFPIMSNKDFASVVCPTGILTSEEQLQILLYIAGGSSSGNNLVAHFPFETLSRRNITLNIFEGVRIVNDVPFICTGVRATLLYLNVSAKIVLESVGFLGPVKNDKDKDGKFDVVLEIWRFPPDYAPRILVGKVKRKVCAKQGRVFHVAFEDPVVLEANATLDNNKWSGENGYYFINFILKGPETQSAEFLNGAISKYVLSVVDGIAVYTRHYFNQGAELRFSKFQETKSN